MTGVFDDAEDVWDDTPEGERRSCGQLLTVKDGELMEVGAHIDIRLPDHVPTD